MDTRQHYIDLNFYEALKYFSFLFLISNISYDDFLDYTYNELEFDQSTSHCLLSYVNVATEVFITSPRYCTRFYLVQLSAVVVNSFGVFCRCSGCLCSCVVWLVLARPAIPPLPQPLLLIFSPRIRGPRLSPAFILPFQWEGEFLSTWSSYDILISMWETINHWVSRLVHSYSTLKYFFCEPKS